MQYAEQMFAKLTFISLLIYHILLLEQKEGIKNVKELKFSSKFCIPKFCLE